VTAYTLCRNIVSEFWLFVDLFRYTKHLHLLAPLVPKSVTSYSIWQLASYLFRWFLWSQPFFTRDAYCIARPCYGFLSVLPSVRPSVSRKVCPRHRAVSAASELLVIYGVHIGAIWRWQIWLNHPCAAAMRPYVKLLWPFVQYLHWCT